MPVKLPYDGGDNPIAVIGVVVLGVLWLVEQSLARLAAIKRHWQTLTKKPTKRQQARK